MAITVAQLVEFPHLRLSLVAGDGGSGNTIRWAHSSDHPHPEQWLTGGELLLRNGETIPADADE